MDRIKLKDLREMTFEDDGSQFFKIFSEIMNHFDDFLLFLNDEMKDVDKMDEIELMERLFYLVRKEELDILEELERIDILVRLEIIAGLDLKDLEEIERYVEEMEEGMKEMEELVEFGWKEAKDTTLRRAKEAFEKSSFNIQELDILEELERIDILLRLEIIAGLDLEDLEEIERYVEEMEEGMKEMEELVEFGWKEAKDTTLRRAKEAFEKSSFNLRRDDINDPWEEVLSRERLNKFGFKVRSLIIFFNEIEDFISKKLEMKTLFQLSFNKIKNSGVGPYQMEPFLNQFGLYYIPVSLEETKK